MVDSLGQGDYTGSIANGNKGGMLMVKRKQRAMKLPKKNDNARILVETILGHERKRVLGDLAVAVEVVAKQKKEVAEMKKRKEISSSEGGKRITFLHGLMNGILLAVSAIDDDFMTKYKQVMGVDRS